MRKILLLMLCLPLMLSAKTKRDDSKYLEGAVPEVNGQVLFQQTFAVKDRDKNEIYKVMQYYLHEMLQQDIQMKGSKMVMEDDASDTLIARFEEWMTFVKKPLYWDRTRFRYVLTVSCYEDKCHLQLTQISYYYEEDNDGYNGRTYRAEEWINDANALNKKKTKLLYGSDKFRRKTVDRVEEIFNGAREMFERKIVIPEAAETIEEEEEPDPFTATKLIED